MMGPATWWTGAAAWVARTGPATELVGLSAADPDVVLLGALITAGAALISDWDHPRATSAHARPLLTNIITLGRPRGTGGHRNGTHTHCSGWPPAPCWP